MIDLCIASKLLFWFDHHGRSLPWRTQKGHIKNPYYIWLAEIMLQQTTVATVYGYFDKFIMKWPDIFSLAAANIDDILLEWAGLGYYSRAHNLHKCAQEIVQKYQGIFPKTEAELLELPGIGPYTAAAISAIAFDMPATIVDANVERVISRLFCIEEPLPKSKPLIRERAQELTPQQRPGNYAEAIMDLGATVCRQSKPLCVICPLSADCLACKRNVQEEYPKKMPKEERPIRKAVLFWVEAEGAIILQKRPMTGLLAGLWELPSTPWDTQTYAQYSKKPITEIYKPITDTNFTWKTVEGTVYHHFTHFTLEMTIHHCTMPQKTGDFHWAPLQLLEEYALPTVMKKALRFVLSHKNI